MRPQTEDKEERAVPAFDDMEEPTVEIAVWTTALEEALKKVSEEAMADEGELSPQVVDANRQKYKDMLSSLALRDATEEEYLKTRGVGQPYRGMTSGGRGTHRVPAGQLGKDGGEKHEKVRDGSGRPISVGTD